MFGERFDHALVFAHGLHRGQKRKVAGVPYICHLLGVAALVIEDGGGEDEAIAALLHDSIEDQGSHYPGGKEQLRADIGRDFGAEVRRIVEACTEDYVHARERHTDRRAQWRAFKEAYVEHIRAADAAVRRVSCADSLHNVRAITADHRRLGDEIWKRFRTKTPDDQLWFYDLLARAFLETGGGRLAGELDRAVGEMFEEAGRSRPAVGQAIAGWRK